ncbi:MAG: hypothetical protein L3J33_03190 [Rhodobacteraceae bacterium]|nr:hypothetical protein [Paracoccaceae bacterium]
MVEKTGTNLKRGADKASKKDARAERLQAQLRANLQKRKGQARARVADASEKDK